MKISITDLFFRLLFILIISLNLLSKESVASRTPKHDVEIPVHQWIAYQASKIWSSNELLEHIEDYPNTVWSNGDDPYSDNDGFQNDGGVNGTSEGILIGSAEEDMDSNDEDLCCNNPAFSCDIALLNKPYCYHFWDSDKPQSGDYDFGLIYGGFQYGSAYIRAEKLYNKAKSLYLGGDVNQAYYWLGRVAHLLTDMCVPAHVHNDPHPGIGILEYFDEYDDDEFEDFMKRSNSIIYGKRNYQAYSGYDYEGKQYNYENITCPSKVNINASNLFKLFWYTTQKTQNFASDDKYGNDIYVEENGQEWSWTTANYLWSGEGKIIINDPGEIEDSFGDGNGYHLYLIAEALIPHAMKAVAGLYRLFWHETHPTVNASAGPNGSINPNGTFEVIKGSSQQFTAYPDTNYVVDKWYRNNNLVQSESDSYTLHYIQVDAEIYVTFKPIIGDLFPNLEYDSYHIKSDTIVNFADPQGENDGKITSGERIELHVNIHNSGAEIANNVSATLSTSDDYITIISDHILYGNVPDGSTKGMNVWFIFDVPFKCPNDHIASFNLEIQSDEGEWNDSFQIPIFNFHPVDVNAGTGLNDGEINLNWSSAYGAIGYKIYYFKYGDKIDSLYDVMVFEPGNVTQWKFNNLIPGKEYLFIVTAYNNNGETPMIDKEGYSMANAIAKGGFFTDINAGLKGFVGGSAAWGDYDNDGYIDILLAGGISKIYHNNSGESFTEIDSNLPGITGHSDGKIAWFDYDNDGDLDILLQGHGIYRNDNNEFTKVNTGLTFIGNETIDYGDYDNDGDLDLILTGGTTCTNNYTKIYQNEDGRFIPAHKGLQAVQLGSAFWGDYDNDGDLDLVIGGEASCFEVQTTIVYLNDNLDFINTNFTIRGGGFSLWGDYDNDGYLDLVKSDLGWHSYIYKSYLSSSEIRFYKTDIDLGKIRISSGDWGDYDNDGDLDLLVIGDIDWHNVSMIYNNSEGNLSEINTGLIGVQSGSVAWGDYDNDGDLDILLTGSDNLGKSVFKIYRNDYTPEPGKKGDINGDGVVDLKDAIIGLQVLSGQNPSGIKKGAEVYENGKIGWGETIYALQIVSGLNLISVQETFTNSLDMTFKKIPAGTFTMGSPADELERYSNETQHQVTLTQSFYMQTTEVTQGQWIAVMGSNPSYFPNCGDDCPVEYVSWDDIQLFITALNQQTGQSYRLPTEAEWEYTARAGSSTAFANGDITVTGDSCDSDSNLDAMGWYCANSNFTTHPVAQKQPNAWGLYDMHGNVEEYCQDSYGNYPTEAVTDPTGPTSGSGHVHRGGNFEGLARHSRSAIRFADESISRFRRIGFRLVLPQIS